MKKELRGLHIDLTRPEVAAWASGETEKIPPDILAFVEDLEAGNIKPIGLDD